MLRENFEAFVGLSIQREPESQGIIIEKDFLPVVLNCIISKTEKSTHEPVNMNQRILSAKDFNYNEYLHT